MGEIILSLDIWDTVLRRRCHPDESKFGLSKYVILKYYYLLKEEYKNVLPYVLVKLRMDCEHILADDNMKKDLDDEYVINDVLYMWIDQIMVNIPNMIKDKLVDEFIEYELKHEIYISYLDPSICNNISQKQYDKLIYISDFYMRKIYMDKLIERYSDDLRFDDGFVSCDYYLNKKSGRLFNLIKELNGVPSYNHTHIGDNIKSDIKCPRKLGINAIRYLPLKEHVIRNIHRINYYLRCRLNFHSTGNIFGYIWAVKKQLRGLKSEDTYKNLGIDNSFYFITYIMANIETAIKEQVQEIYYFTREGEFFKKIHEAIEKADVFGFPIPKAKLLEVSRMATYAPSIKEISIDGMMRLWSQYPNQSIDAYFKSLNLSIECYMPYLTKFGLENIAIPLEKIFAQEAVINLFKDEDFVKKLEEDIEKKRCLLLKYLKQKGIHQNKEKIFIVDIGWRGSIQDNIALLFPNMEVVGYYMGLFRTSHEKIPNTRKIAFVSSDEQKNYLWYLRHPYPIEMYSNSRNGSVVGYIEMEDGGVKAIRNNYSSEDIIYDNYVDEFQQGILLTVPAYGQMIRTYSFSSNELRDNAIRSLKKFIIKPSNTLIKPYFELVNNSIFGIGKMEDLSLKFSLMILLKAFISPKGFRTLINSIEDSHWPHGLFMKYHLTFFNWYYSRFAGRMYLHYNCIEPLGYNKKVKISLKSYEEMDLRIKYKRDVLISNSVCRYIRGYIYLPKNLSYNYEIFIKIMNNRRTLFFNTTRIIKYKSSKKDQISFEVKIPWRNRNIERMKQEVIVVDHEKSAYMTFEI
ncbi:MAG: hypothetical protein ACOWWH_12995 [Eubacteriaceae bacterium]